ncbi:hypothetical protein [Sebaldella sp. S0638]|uniref:hypothetical protein n=1 Tax=Sebaldella sp. S0638 TaxID=2957809 RepID=UPI00209D35DA|nr:hypothetical protein [Sebaldella sp. S0638]MCP1226722.1 hypothetical protein [Sebaldella sp. S0638]
MRYSINDLFEIKQKDFYNSLNNINTVALAKIIEVNNISLEADIKLISYIEFKNIYGSVQESL